MTIEERAYDALAYTGFTATFIAALCGSLAILATVFQNWVS